MRTSIGHMTTLQRTLKFWLKEDQVIVNQSIINHDLIRNVQTSRTCTQAQINLRRVTNLELTC
jgi:hypothetical protein